MSITMKGIPSISGISAHVDSGPPPPTYATWNPVGAGANFIFSNGNLTIKKSAAGLTSVKATVGMPSFSGGPYYETTVNALTAPVNLIIGFGSGSSLNTSFVGVSIASRGYRGNGTMSQAGATPTPPPPTFAAGDVIGCLLDTSGFQLHFYKNGVPVGALQPYPTGTGLTYPMITINDSIATVTTNFGATPFLFPPFPGVPGFFTP